MSVTNKYIARSFNLLGKLLELHQDNPFKIRSYYAAYNTLRRIEEPLDQMSDEALQALPGIGKTIVEKIRELNDTGTLAALEKVRSKTPEGVVDMLSIRGLGPKKVYTIWNDIGITSPGELLLACNENRLVNYKGFGLKTQLDIAKNLEFYMDSQGRYHYANVVDEAYELLDTIRQKEPNVKIQLVGDIARKMPEVDGIHLICDTAIDPTTLGLELDEEQMWRYHTFPVKLEIVSPTNWGNVVFENTSSETFRQAASYDPDTYYATEEELIHNLHLAPIPYEYREHAHAAKQARKHEVPQLLVDEDIKGIVHNHSTYSDGLHTVSQMAQRCIDLGYEYFVISDHSRTAAYAGGLNIEQVEMQWREIDQLNQHYKGFKIFKSIESDILTDGSLDYPADILEGFDLVIASIHSNLNMDEATATKRIITAIENPYTRILGHPTGRLLLGRKGYPLDFKKVIDAAAANNVCIELNANPQRLDLDWTHLPYALDKGVMIAINPDAHSMDQISLVKYGVCVARKGGLTKEMCLNAMSLTSFEQWIAK